MYVFAKRKMLTLRHVTLRYMRVENKRNLAKSTVLNQSPFVTAGAQNCAFIHIVHKQVRSTASPMTSLPSDQPKTKF